MPSRFAVRITRQAISPLQFWLIMSEMVQVAAWLPVGNQDFVE